MRERNKTHVERGYELFGELAGRSREEIAAGLAAHEKMIIERGSRKLTESGGPAKATAVGAVQRSAPNVVISDAEAVAKAIWDFCDNPESLGGLKAK